MMYKHKNKGKGIITIFDKEMKRYTLRPGNEVIINRKFEGNGIKVIEEIQETKTVSKKKIETKNDEIVMEDD